MSLGFKRLIPFIVITETFNDLIRPGTLTVLTGNVLAEYLLPTLGVWGSVVVKALRY